MVAQFDELVVRLDGVEDIPMRNSVSLKASSRSRAEAAPLVCMLTRPDPIALGIRSRISWQSRRAAVCNACRSSRLRSSARAVRHQGRVVSNVEADVATEIVGGWHRCVAVWQGGDPWVTGFGLAVSLSIVVRSRVGDAATSAASADAVGPVVIFVGDHCQVDDVDVGVCTSVWRGVWCECQAIESGT